LNFCPTRSRTSTRWPGAGRKLEGSIQKSCAWTPDATSRARAQQQRTARRIIVVS